MCALNKRSKKHIGKLTNITQTKDTTHPPQKNNVSDSNIREKLK